VEQAPSLPNNDRWKNSHNQAVERFTYRGKSYSLFATSNHPRKKASLALAIPFHGALSAREGGKAFGVALCGHVVAKNQPLVVTDLARDPRFAESPFLINMDFAFTPECRCLVPARLAFRAAFSLESG
jgi:hypothetical protein